MTKVEPPNRDYGPGSTFSLEGLHELNERCITLLVNAARAEAPPPFPLVTQLRDILRNSKPDVRRRAAQRGFLLLDMEFRHAEWWQAVRAEPNKQWRTASWRGAFPRRSAVPLTRSVLMFAWHSIQADPETACVILGMTRSVAELIGELQLGQIDTIADRRFRHIQPRWHDRPAVWRALLRAAENATPTAMRRVDLHGLQLITGELLPEA